MHCPCCAQPIAIDDRIMIDVEGGFVAGGGHITRLTESEFNLFHMIWSSQPRTVSREKLMTEAYWRRSDDEEPEIKIIDVFVCKLRKKLLPLGVVIDTVWGRGYRILPQGRASE
jgi:DNA-binding response OmpR family regulator